MFERFSPVVQIADVESNAIAGKFHVGNRVSTDEFGQFLRTDTQQLNLLLVVRLPCHDDFPTGHRQTAFSSYGHLASQSVKAAL